MPYTGIQAQKELEDLGFVVDVQKIYSDYDENGYILVNPGYTYYTEPAAGTSRNQIGDTRDSLCEPRNGLRRQCWRCRMSLAIRRMKH